SLLIAYNDRIWMQLQRTRRTNMGHLTLDGLPYCRRFGVSCSEDYHLLGIAHGSDAHCNRLSGHSLYIPTKEARISNTCFHRKVDQARTRLQRRKRLIERYMAIHTNSSQE